MLHTTNFLDLFIFVVVVVVVVILVVVVVVILVVNIVVVITSQKDNRRKLPSPESSRLDREAPTCSGHPKSPPRIFHPEAIKRISRI